MATTRHNVIFTVTALLFLATGHMFYNLSCSYHSVHPKHVDPDIPVPPVNITYINATKTMIVDAAREWELQSQSADIKFLNKILWVVTLGSSNLVYAPYHEFHRILREEDLTNSMLIIEKSDGDSYSMESIAVIEQTMKEDCDLEWQYRPMVPAVVGKDWRSSCVVSESEIAYRTDSFYLNVSGNLNGHRNCHGGTVASPSEIVSQAVFTATMLVWIWMVIVMLLCWKQEDTQDLISPEEEDMVKGGEVIQ